MHKDEEIPKVTESASLRDALVEMTRKKLGMTAIVDEHNKVLGIYTDGDLRRTLDKNIDVHSASIAEVMSRNCKTTHANILAAEVLKLMDDHKINAILVVDDDNNLVGALNMHDLLRAGVV